MAEESCSLSDHLDLPVIENSSTPERNPETRLEGKLSPSIEMLIKKLKNFYLETPQKPRTVTSTPTKLLTPIKLNSDSLASAVNEDQHNFNCAGINQLKQSLGMRHNIFSSPSKSSPIRRRLSIDNNTLRFMLAREHHRRQFTEADSDLAETSLKTHLGDSPILSRSMRFQNSLLDNSTQALVGSPIPEYDSSLECVPLKDDEDISTLEHSFHEVSEVFFVLMESNRAMAKSKATKKYTNVFDRQDLVGEEIFREAVDVSFGDLVTSEQKDLICDSYLRMIDADQQEPRTGNETCTE